MSTRIRIGLVGLGEISQTVHMPILQSMSDRYTVSGVCDVSRELVDRFAPPGVLATTTFEDLVRSDEIDLVFVLTNGPHARIAIDAMNAGKDVFIEKPMAMTLREARAIAEFASESGRIVFVGQMRRYAPAFVALKNDLPGLGNVLYANIRDIIGPNEYFIDQVHVVRRGTDLPESATADRREAMATLIKEAVGDVGAELASAYGLLCGLGVHDLSLMRDLFGMPDAVTATDVWARGRFIRSTFDYGGYRVGYETGLDRNGRFDAGVEVIAENGTARVVYDTPYIRQLPTTYERTETDGESFVRTLHRPTYTDPFTVELRELYRCVTERTHPRTSADDSIEDLRLFRAMIRAADERHPVKLADVETTL